MLLHPAKKKTLASSNMMFQMQLGVVMPEYEWNLPAELGQEDDPSLAGSSQYRTGTASQL